METYSSRLFVQDIEIAKRPSKEQAGMDMAMMLTFGAKERTRKDWEQLFGKVGLEIEDAHVTGQKSLMICRLIARPCGPSEPL